MNKLKSYLLLLLLSFTGVELVAQEQSTNQGSVYDFFRAGIGFSSHYIKKSDYLELAVPHVFIEGYKEVPNPLEIGEVYVGVSAGFASYDWVTASNDKAGSISFVNLGVTGYYFYPLTDQITPYSGLGVFYNQPLVSFEPGFESNEEPESNLGYSWNVGVKYELTSNMAVFFEAGVGQLNLKTGIILYQN
ncbi:MAG: hypothetical protein Roseis2KO_42670 [Roseivirga sp.]